MNNLQKELQKANKHIKKCPKSLAIKETKTTAGFHLTPVRKAASRKQTNAGKDMGKRNPHTLLVGM
jgi:hypothetical protein